MIYGRGVENHEKLEVDDRDRCLGQVELLGVDWGEDGTCWVAFLAEESGIEFEISTVLLDGEWYVTPALPVVNTLH